MNIKLLNEVLTKVKQSTQDYQGDNRVIKALVPWRLDLMDLAPIIYSESNDLQRRVRMEATVRFPEVFLRRDLPIIPGPVFRYWVKLDAPASHGSGVLGCVQAFVTDSSDRHRALLPSVQPGTDWMQIVFGEEFVVSKYKCVAIAHQTRPRVAIHVHDRITFTQLWNFEDAKIPVSTPGTMACQRHYESLIEVVFNSFVSGYGPVDQITKSADYQIP